MYVCINHLIYVLVSLCMGNKKLYNYIYTLPWALHVPESRVNISFTPCYCFIPHTHINCYANLHMAQSWVAIVFLAKYFHHWPILWQWLFLYFSSLTGHNTSVNVKQKWFLMGDSGATWATQNLKCTFQAICNCFPLLRQLFKSFLQFYYLL